MKKPNSMDEWYEAVATINDLSVGAAEKEVEEFASYECYMACLAIKDSDLIDDLFMKKLKMKGYSSDNLKHCVEHYSKEMFDFIDTRDGDGVFDTFTLTAVMFEFCVWIKDRKHQLEFEF